jgi:RimJ/RimL family protein N-acetyltransferase
MNPLLLNFPDQFETERLLIRAPRPGDGQAVYAAVVESFDHLHPWMAWAKTLQSLDETEEFMRRGASLWLTREHLHMNLYRKSDGLFVGASGLHHINWSVPAFEIGYWVRLSLQGQGFIGEAVEGITQFAFDKLGAQRMEIRCDSRNVRSAAVAKRAGYTLEGCFRHDERDNEGHLRDTLIFAKITENES